MNGGEQNAVTAKTVAICVLFIASMALGLFPIVLSRLLNWSTEPQKKPIVQKLLCVGGGVLLCTTFVHLLPEVSEKIQHLEEFPMNAELLMCVGFFTMYVLEEIVHFIAQRHQSHTAVDSDDWSEHHHRGHSHYVSEESALRSLRGLFVVLALSVHELFEGLAVGLETSSKNVWYMFGAVSAHKLLIAFCIGVELVSSQMRTLLVVIYIFIFAVVSPVGIGLGLVVSSEDSTDFLSVLLQGFASGTLLYVVFFEILTSERKSGVKHFSCVLAGFLVMFLIKYLGD